MALSATTIAEVESGGSDTLNGGLFDPSQTAGMFADGAATVANTAAPVFTSASYNFLSPQDVGAWIYIASGTNWTAGWYKITSVAANAATLNATIGQGVLKTLFTPSTVVGCATVASPTAATWTIDYSQQLSAQFAYVDLASTGTGLTVSSSGKPFAKQHVGNSLVITGGTNFNVGRYVIASVAAAVATVVGPTNITTGVGATGTGGQGGAFASPGQAASVRVAGNPVFLKAATYSITSASTNISGGCISDTVGGNGFTWTGYGTVRGDGGIATIQASGIATFTLLAVTAAATAGYLIGNLTVDGASLTASQGIANGRRGVVYNCSITNCTNLGVSSTASILLLQKCNISNITGGASAINGSLSVLDSAVHGNTVTAIIASAAGSLCLRNLVYGNTGVSSDGINMTGGESICASNSIYGNGRDGVRISIEGVIVEDNICEGNTGFAISGAAIVHPVLINNAAFNNTAGNLDTTNLQGINTGFVTGISSFFVNAAGGNFALNNTTGAGAAARAAAYPGVFPVGTTTGYLDIGAVQHQDTPSTSSIFPIFD